MNIFIQVIGFVAMIFSVFSFQMNKHKQIMIMQIIATLLFGLQYFLLGAYTGVALDIVASIRGVVFYNKDKKWASNNIWIVIFVLAFIVLGIFTWQGWKSILIILAMVLNTFSFSFTKPKLVRSTILMSSPMMLLYNILTGSVGGIINEIFVEISSLIGILIHDVKRKVPKNS